LKSQASKGDLKLMDEIKEVIAASNRLKDILRDFPELTDYFLEMGICGCGDEDLTRTLKQTADERRIYLNMLLEDLNKRIEGH